MPREMFDGKAELPKYSKGGLPEPRMRFSGNTPSTGAGFDSLACFFKRAVRVSFFVLVSTEMSSSVSESDSEPDRLSSRSIPNYQPRFGWRVPVCCYTPYQFVKFRLAHSLETFQSLLEIVFMKVRSDMTTLFKDIQGFNIAQCAGCRCCYRALVFVVWSQGRAITTCRSSRGR